MAQTKKQEEEIKKAMLQEPPKFYSKDAYHYYTENPHNLSQKKRILNFLLM